MNRIRTIWSLIIGVLLIASCNENKKVTTESGFKYEYIKHGDGEEAIQGEFILLNLIYKDENDSVWLNTIARRMPLVVPRQRYVKGERLGNVNEIFYNLVRGDSITFNLNASVFYNTTFTMKLPEHVKQDMLLTFNAGVQEIYTPEEMEVWKKIKTTEKEIEVQNDIVKQNLIDSAKIQEYLKVNNMEAINTESGLNYVIIEKGDGERPKNGDKVLVNYTGRVLGGEYFDSSVKSVAEEKGIYSKQREPYEPIEFILGQGQVIKGWDEGVSYLNAGAKAIFLIPSSLGYGQRAINEKLPENSILIFDVELLKIQ